MCDGELVYRIGLTPEQIVGKELTDFRPLPDAKRELQYYRRAWEGENYVTYEAESNGIWYLASLRPIRRGGVVTEVIASCVDITKRVKREQEVSLLTERLAEQERKYRLIADNTDDFIVLLDRDGIVQYISPSHERLLGFSMEGSEGKFGFQKIHPDDVSLVRQRFESVIKSKSSTSVECRYTKADGSYIWVEVAGSPILSPDGEVSHVLAVARNITERKVQEEKLRQSENRYRELVELSPDAIFVHIGGRIVYANKSSVELLAARSVNDLIGRSIVDFIHPDDRNRVLNRVDHLMKAEGNTYGLVEVRYIRFDGAEIDVEATGVGILYGDEHAVQVIIRDTTARKESERKLAEEKEKLKSLLNNAQDAVNIMDLDGKILRVNPAWEAMYGWTQEEVVGKPTPTVSHERFNNGWNRLVERIMRGETIPPYEITVFRKGGEPLYASTSIYPIYDADGKVVAVVESTRDITARKETERKLRESEEKYRLIAEYTQDLIGVLDADGVVHYASPSHETVLGFRPHQYEGHSAFKLVHPDDGAYVVKQFAHMVSSKTPCHVEFRYEHADGRWVYVDATGTPVLNDNGEVEHIVVVARDITERKQAEDMIRKSEKLAVAGQLAAGLAHEIRNPLTAIQGFIQLLKKETDKPLYFDVMMSEIARLNDIVTELLALAKPQVVQRRDVHPKTLLEQVLTIMGSQALLHNIEIKQEYDSNLPCIYCDDNQMKQVFINILQNAVEAMPNGGTITAQISLHDPQSIQFRFIDQGCGIPQERMKHIGEPFYSSKEKGTGLGLMISLKIVQEHGGTLHIDSVVNRGTTVDVILPIKHYDGSEQ
ncbi:PAS domain S-box protein [Alicyclobacillus acidoterrestris]